MGDLLLPRVELPQNGAVLRINVSGDGFFSAVVDDWPVVTGKAVEISEHGRPVVHGGWRAVSFHEIACKKCGYIIDIMKVDVNHLNFCNECGADMRPEEPERESAE